LVDQRGSLVSTSNATDLAVRGRGFLPVTPASDVEVENGEDAMMLTTTGSFRTDAEGFLKSESGLVLLGWPALADGSIPSYPRDTADGLQPVQINVNEFSGEPTTQMTLGINLPATETDSDASGDPQVLSIEYFDNLGTSESVAITFTPTIDPLESSNEWTMEIRDSVDPATVIGQYTLNFNNDRTAGGTLDTVDTLIGGAYDENTGKLIIQVDGGPLEIDIGLPDETGGISQLSDSFAPVSISKDGSPVGNMTAVEVDANGYIHAFFDTGITRTIYQVPLVALPNPNGMVALDQQTYQPSVESGSFFLWDASDGPTGDIVAFALEESATDVAGELTDMIQTQRAYSSNAKVIQTVDEMLQETTNIKR
jgi:flagellar hook protein FlgE